MARIDLPVMKHLLISAETPADQIPHAKVLQEAHYIYQQKSLLRGDMWREFPPSDKIRELGERVRRIEKLYEFLKDGVEYDAGHPLSTEYLMASIESDGLDLINYTVFMIRQLREGEVG